MVKEMAQQKRWILAGLPYFEKTAGLLDNYLQRDPDRPF
jgi:hypothetical protein